MIDVAWRIDEEDWDSDVTGAPRPVLSTWHFLRNSLRRKWLTWVGLAVVGGILGATYLFLTPPPSSSSVTLYLAHQPGTEEGAAMSTDVSLLNTRAVANAVIADQNLALTPEAFQSTITAEPVTNQILQLTLKAPDDAAAVARADSLVKEYLAFRTDQMQALTNALIDGSKSQIDDLQAQVDALTREYNRFSGTGVAGQTKATDILAKRTELGGQITNLQRSVEDAKLQTAAAVAATHVIDEPRADPHSTLKAAILNVGAGVIAGSAIGMGIVLFRALTSDRLRRRQEVALALGAPVRLSVGHVGPPETRVARLAAGLWRGLTGSARTFRWVLRLAWAFLLGWLARVARLLRLDRWTKLSLVDRLWRRLGAYRRRLRMPLHHDRAQRLNLNLEALVRGLESVILDESGSAQRGGPAAADRSHGPVTVGLAAVHNADVGALVVLALATRLQALGVSVFLVDLSESGAMATARSEDAHPTWAGGHDPVDAPAVFRPSGIPGMSRGPGGATRGAVVDLREEEQLRAGWDKADLVLALVEIDPGLDVENLTSWVDSVVPLVTAGRSSAELLGTIGELVRAVGLELPFAMMVGADRTDESLGLPDAPETRQDRPVIASHR
jgi:capsular polysaccharide biosynthesis protein